jgi:hypothetical protein
MSISKKSATMSFRLDLDVLEKLKTESEKQEISVNTLANQIFKRYAEWGRFETRVGMVPVAKQVLDALFKKLDEKETINLAEKVGKDTVRDIAIFMKGIIDADSFLSWFETRMKSFEINRSILHGKHSYIVKHDIGYNWSLYHKTVLELIFHETFEKKVDIEINENMIKIVFDD